jgi:hypothetical protein
VGTAQFQTPLQYGSNYEMAQTNDDQRWSMFGDSQKRRLVLFWEQNMNELIPVHSSMNWLNELADELSSL